MTTRIVNRYKELFEIDIGRNSCWGNPYSHNSNSLAKYIVPTREEAIHLYSLWILGQIHLIERLGELKDKVLGCYCLPKECHGSVLAKLADNFDPEKEFNDYSAFW